LKGLRNRHFVFQSQSTVQSEKGEISMKILRISCILGGFLFLVLSLSAQTFTTLLSFDNADGANPVAPLVQATNGDFYGTTNNGGANVFCLNGGCGTVFKITPHGKLTTLYSFCQGGGQCTDGEGPLAGLVQATNGDLYGTTAYGGPNGFCVGPYDLGCGTVFKITADGKLTTLYSFDYTDGATPYAGLVQATDGNFYGTTQFGGANGGNGCNYNCGTVFKITPSGKLTTLYSFCPEGGSNCTDGRNPGAGLVQATDGYLYGTASGGGAYGYGTFFKITPSGTLTTLYSFCSQSGCPDGQWPSPTLVQATDGDFYGTTPYGGTGTGGLGTVFRITPGGKLTTLHSFCSQSECTDGRYPYAGLVQATDGYLYGAASGGGAYREGTVFKITSSGTLTTLYSFCSQGGDCTDGASPAAALIQDTNGTLYGTTEWGGGFADCFSKGFGWFPCGTVFSLSVGLGPFVETNPTSGKVGSAVKILGTDLIGASSVTFNGTGAKFTVISKSEIKTTVPEGATTGEVKVKTPKGMLKSNLAFRVMR
jgi:uncharacterized repeat protein (TIGR03803 family)